MSAEQVTLLQGIDRQGIPVLYYPVTEVRAVLGMDEAVCRMINERIGEVDALLDTINGEVV